MSQIINFSDLPLLSAIDSYDQFFIRLNNGLSGLSGFGRATYDTFFTNYSSSSVSDSTTVMNNSANWNAVYSNVNSNSANWNNTFTNFNTQSARNASVFTNVNSNSANWNAVYSNVNSNSASWNSAYTTVNSNSNNWDASYTAVNSNSANWNNTFTNFSNQSANNASVFTNVNSNSANWNSAPSWNNQGMAANTTVSDGDLACSLALSATPIGRVDVIVNGRQVTIGNAAKNKDGYFSNNTGTTSKAYTSIALGDKFYWMGSVAGYQLDPTDIISFNYNA